MDYLTFKPLYQQLLTTEVFLILSLTATNLDNIASDAHFDWLAVFPSSSSSSSSLFADSSVWLTRNAFGLIFGRATPSDSTWVPILVWGGIQRSWTLASKFKKLRSLCNHTATTLSELCIGWQRQRFWSS